MSKPVDVVKVLRMLETGLPSVVIVNGGTITRFTRAEVTAAVLELVEAAKLADRVLQTAHSAAVMQIQTGCAPANLDEIKDAASVARKTVRAALGRVLGVS